ncbi:hypothetical protein CLF_110209, partial [Clonorchis sinensis]
MRIQQLYGTSRLFSVDWMHIQEDTAVSCHRSTDALRFMESPLQDVKFAALGQWMFIPVAAGFGVDKRSDTDVNQLTSLMTTAVQHLSCSFVKQVMEKISLKCLHTDRPYIPRNASRKKTCLELFAVTCPPSPGRNPPTISLWQRSPWPTSVLLKRTLSEKTADVAASSTESPPVFCQFPGNCSHLILGRSGFAFTVRARSSCHGNEYRLSDCGNPDDHSYFAPSHDHVPNERRLLSAAIDGQNGQKGSSSNVGSGKQCHNCKAFWHINCTGLQDDQGSHALEHTSLAWMERSKYAGPSALLSATDDRGAAVNFTPKSQRLSWTGSGKRSQAAKPAGKPTTCADLEIGECCETRTTTVTVKLPISSSTPSKVTSLIAYTVVTQDPDSQSLKPGHSKPESPSYTQLVTLIAGDSDVYTSTKERRLQPNKPRTIHQLRKLLAGFKAASKCPSNQTDARLPLEQRQIWSSRRRYERATSSSGQNFRPRGKNFVHQRRKTQANRPSTGQKNLQMKSGLRNHQAREQT